jgi:hypothetical protein
MQKDYPALAVKPEEMALVQDAVARFADKHPHAARLVSRIEIHYEPDSVTSVASFVPDNLGLVRINIGKFREQRKALGPVAADGVFAHEVTHAAQEFMKSPYEYHMDYWERPSELGAFRRESQTMGSPALEGTAIPFTGREASKHRLQHWRFEDPKTPRGAPGGQELFRGHTPDSTRANMRFEISRNSKGNRFFVKHSGTGKRLSPDFWSEEAASGWLEKNQGKLLLTQPPVVGY